MIHITNDKGIEKLVRERMTKMPPTERLRFSLCERDGTSHLFSRTLIIPTEEIYTIESKGLPNLVNLSEVDEFPEGIVFSSKGEKDIIISSLGKSPYHSIQLVITGNDIYANDFNLRDLGGKENYDKKLWPVCNLEDMPFAKLDQSDLEHVLRKSQLHLKYFFKPHKGFNTSRLVRANMSIFTISYNSDENINVKGFLRNIGYVKQNVNKRIEV